MRAAPAVVAGALLIVGCGGGGGKTASAPLVWARSPLLYRASGLSSDRVLLGQVRNRSDRPLRLTASRLTVRDANGHRVRAWAQFIAGYAHGLYGAYQKPHPLPPGELERLGLVLDLRRGATAPLAVAFRLTPATRAPLRVDYGRGTLAIPRRAHRETQ